MTTELDGFNAEVLAATPYPPPKRYFTAETYRQWRIAKMKKVRRRRADLIERLGGRCVICGATEKLEFDHIDPARKEWETRALSSESRIKRYEDEAAKGLLQLLCRHCNAVKGRKELAGA